ncbi:hypothetical protein [Salinactinospora qingdaonensis]|uniref:PsbP C-terminal domain-containing protein n=1 Tax=Salinactinospora qingdaonensis TaxID=702744 RepID=A0ABP7FR63_9ACTN
MSVLTAVVAVISVVQTLPEWLGGESTQRGAGGSAHESSQGQDGQNVAGALPPEDPAGWQRVEVEGISFAMPGQWEELSSDQVMEGFARVFYHRNDEDVADIELEVMNDFTAEYDAMTALDALTEGTEVDPLMPIESYGLYEVYEISPSLHRAGRYEFGVEYRNEEGGEIVATGEGVYYSVQVSEHSAPVVLRVQWLDDSPAADDVDTILQSIRAA